MFLYHKWLELDLATRNKIASDFNIKKKNSTHVQDNVVVSDGYLIKDVEEALNIDALQKKLGTDETDMQILWEYLIYGKPIEIPMETIIAPIKEIHIKDIKTADIYKMNGIKKPRETKKRDRPSKK
jgi:hypothetical protein